MKNLSFLALTAAILLLSACSKDSKSSATNTTAGSYVTCPSTGYYSNNGYNQQCTPGQQIYVGGTGTTGSSLLCPTEGYYVLNGYQQSCSPGSTMNVTSGSLRCPSAGYYVYNGMQQSCMAGQTVTLNSYNNGGTYNPTYPNNNNNVCAQYTQMYGVPYTLQYINGQQYCVRSY